MKRRLIIEPSHFMHITRNTKGADSIKITVSLQEATSPGPGLDFKVTTLTSRKKEPPSDTGYFLKVSKGSASKELVKWDPDSQLLTPIGTGTGINDLEIRYWEDTPGFGVTQVLVSGTVKIQVHDELNGWWFGNDLLTVPKDSRVFHCQVSIYARFDASSNPNGLGDIEDITGHSFVNLVEDDPNIAELSPDKRGRLKGKKTGTTKITGNFLNLPPESLDVKVVNFYGDPTNPSDLTTIQKFNPLLKKVSDRGSSDEKFNILFLAEGYTSSEEPLFNQAVKTWTRQLFKVSRHDPFKLLKREFNVWKAFNPSHESGITSSGTSSLQLGANKIIKFKLQAVDTFLGFYRALRDGEPPLTLFGTEEDETADPRRYPPEINWKKSIGRYIATLTYQKTNKKVGLQWYNDKGGYLKDRGLVIILLNHKMRKDYNSGSLIIMGMDRDRDFTHSLSPQPRASRTLVKIFKATDTKKEKLKKITKWISARLDKSVDILAHELGHSFNLGDEYEEIADSVSMPDSLYSNHNSKLEISTGTGSPQPIDPNKLKWAKLHRISKSGQLLSSKIIAVALDKTDPADIKLILTLEKGQAKKWRKKDSPVYVREFRQEVFTNTLQETTFVPENRFLPHANDLVVFENLDIATVTIKTDNIVLNNLPSELQSMTNNSLQDLLKPGSVLFKPLLDKTNNPIFLVDQEVMDYMGPPRNTPITRHTPCDQISEAVGRPTKKLKAFVKNESGRKIRTKDISLIGAFEGAQYTCGLFRPAGACKMRFPHRRTKIGRVPKVATEFCYVCKYVIVSMVNPGKLADLEKKYPEIK